MKISIETKQIELEFPSGNKYFVELDLKASTFTWKCQLDDLPNNILRLRTHASELMQIATLVKDQLNMVKGYEFNEDVEAKKEPSEEENLKAIYFGFYDQMDEPERSEAKANFISGDLNCDSIDWALRSGFYWEDNPQGSKYWTSIKEKYIGK